MGWMPIDLAPQDGRDLLVFVPSHNLQAYQDFAVVARWVSRDYDGREGWFDNFDMIEPTHFVYIPEFPRW